MKRPGGINEPYAHGFSGRGFFSGLAETRDDRNGSHSGEKYMPILHGSNSFLLKVSALCALGVKE
jgi:hypothetical protein